ncbi:hypothetical protein BJX70DRAFT_379212 [Aspergillus crustosus]
MMLCYDLIRAFDTWDSALQHAHGYQLGPSGTELVSMSEHSVTRGYRMPSIYLMCICESMRQETIYASNVFRGHRRQTL